MAFSGNGWLVLSTRALQREHLITIEPVPGRKFRVHRDTADLFAWFIYRFHTDVEPIDDGVLDDWSFVVRPVRGGRTPSTHGSGTAVDLNATKHPLGKRNTFTKDQRKAIKHLMDEAQGALTWGGVWKRKDEMHFQISRGFTPHRIKEVVKMLPPIGQYKVGERTLDIGAVGLDVVYVQTRIGLHIDGIDGDYGPNTANAVRAWQEARNLDADGVVGPQTWKALMDHVPAAPVAGDCPEIETQLAAARGALAHIHRTVNDAMEAL